MGNRNMDVEKRNAEKTVIDLYAGVCLPKCEAVRPNAWTVSSVSHMMCKFVNDHRYFRRLTSFPLRHVSQRRSSLESQSALYKNQTSLGWLMPVCSLG